jgi:protoporphyrinogen oxidase
MAASFVHEDPDYWCYDFGPHRFHTTDEQLREHVKEILGGNHVAAKRKSRIVLGGRWYDYPLKATNVVRNMPPLLLVKAFLDYFWARFKDRTGLKKYKDDSFESWVERRFGRTLYTMFFGMYTEKAWGMPPSTISADWASQRISLLNLGDAVKQAIFKPKDVPRTLVTDFVYPEYGGIGEISRGYEKKICEMGGTVLVDAPAVRVHREGNRVTKIEYGGRGDRRTVEGDRYISTIPITALAKSVTPPAPQHVRDALAQLRYVSIVFVYLKLDKPQVSPDNWVYLPEPALKTHRISEFKNFSPKCAPEGKTMVCAEITCRSGDEIWTASDDELERIAVADLVKVGLIEESEVLGSFVRRIPYAYPVYDLTYKEHLAPIREFIDSLENIETGGRQGLFRYNNMDQSIEMGREMGLSIVEGRETAHEDVATEFKYFG